MSLLARRVFGLMAGGAFAFGLVPQAGAATYPVYSCPDYQNSAPAFSKLTGGINWNLPNECDAGRSLEINDFSAVQQGKGSGWVAYSPSPALGIVGAYTPVNAVAVDCTLGADGFRAEYAWGSGSEGISDVNGCGGDGIGSGSGINTTFRPSKAFGWGVTCRQQGGCQSSAKGGRILAVKGVRLTVEEDAGPALDAVPASNLWYASGWVRGSWSITLDASDLSGVCVLATVFDGKGVASWTDPNRDTSSFAQCHGSQLPGQLDTTSYSNGKHTLTYGASNAAGVITAPSKTISIDNSPVSLTLSGPTDAPSTAGTQHVNASATAGPSGVAAIFCSVDGSSYARYGGATAQVPVSGVGAHHVSCFAQNNSMDASGTPASSPTETWNLTIREPTVAAIAFAKVVDALRCHKVSERVRVPGRWILVHRHHKPVRIRGHAHEKTIHATRCRGRSARRREVVWKTVRRNGKLVRIKQTKVVRVVLLPHVVDHPVREVPFGSGTTVSGWLGLATGTALRGAPVRVFAAPDNGSHDFKQIAVVTTNSDGSWRARLAPGPGRLVVGYYGGSNTTEPAFSSPVRLVVPAKVRLRIRPTRTHWAATILISGRVLGGYIPVGKFLRLRIGISGVKETIGIPDVRRDGRFRTTFKFELGHGTVQYWFSVSTLREADYPFAPASSPRVTVTVGPG